MNDHQLEFVRYRFVNDAHQEGNPLNACHEFVVQARGDTWALDILVRKHPELHALIQRIVSGTGPVDAATASRATKTLVSDLWLHPGWIRVDPTPCETCGAYHALCALCDDVARYFLDDETRNGCSHLCDEHGSVFNDAYEAGNFPEVGLYTPGGDCCDPWR